MLYVGNVDNPDESMFVCEPENEIPTTLLCDGVNDCGTGNDETTSLCESEPDFPVSLLNRIKVCLSPTQTSAGYLIMGVAPLLESVLHQSLM